MTRAARSRRGRGATTRSTLPRRHTSLDRGEIDLVLVRLGVAQRRGLGVELGCAAAVRRSAWWRMLRPSAYAAITAYSMPLCTIFTKWPAPTGPQCRKPCSWSFGSPVRAGRARRRFDARCERGEDRAEVRERVVGAADHHAVAALESPYAAAGADVDVPDAARLECGRARHVVAVEAVAAVDHHVARFERRERVRRRRGRRRRPAP